MNNENSVVHNLEEIDFLKDHSRPLVRFIASTNYCTKLVCSTCAGLLGFSVDLKENVNKNNLHLETLLMEIEMETITAQKDWKAYYGAAIRTLTSSQSRNIIFNHWEQKKNKNKEFSEFLIILLNDEWIIGKPKAI